MNKNAIKKFAIDARNKLIASVTDKAGMLGITKDACSEPITKGADFEVYKTTAGTEVTLNKKQCEHRRKLVEQIKARGFDAVIEEVAYTWFNRICAIRFMEVNDYMYPARVRVLSSEKAGKNEPDILTQAPDIDWSFTDEEREYIIDAKMNNKLDDLFRMLFIKQCNLLHEVLPGLFEETEDYTEMLLNISFTNEDDVIRMLIDSVDEADFNVSTLDENGNPTGQVEIIGWLYQYYNTELKDDTFAKLKKNVKITKERIPAATQLFTPDWIVRYMVENSVGRIWIEHLRANDPSVDEKATAERFGWKYYLPEAEQEADVNVKLAEIRTTYKDLKPTDITCIDPCMGSGHILIAMFDVLMDIYESAGYDKREAAFDIVEHNIHGLDIDKRAYQLAYFAVMMKGRGYNRRFFRGRDDVKPAPKVYAIMESNDIEKNHLQFFGISMPDSERTMALEQINYLLHTFVDAREYGSILNVDVCDWKLLDTFVNDLDDNGQVTFESLGSNETQMQLKQFIKISKRLYEKYDVVVTNPPYMGMSNASAKLKGYVKDKFVDGKSDLFSVFMIRCKMFCKKSGYQSMITQHSWMFLESFLDIRRYFEKKNLINMVHLGARAFDEISGEVVQTVSFIYKNEYIGGYNSKFKRLTNGTSELEKRLLFNSMDLEFVKKIEDFEIIPNQPFAYWVNIGVINSFKNNKLFATVGTTKKGVLTGNDNKFVRLWYEVSNISIGFGLTDYQDMLNKNYKWIPATGGGSYRKWYGNFEKVINMKDDSYDIRYNNSNNYRLRDPKYYFRECGTWSEVAGRGISMRYVPQGILFGNSGPVCFFEEDIFYYIGLINSEVAKIFLEFLSPTLTYGPEQIKRIPIICVQKELVIDLVKRNIQLAKSDWDSYETSWDYARHPLCKYPTKIIKEAYKLWNREKYNSRNELLDNENKIDEILSRAYNIETLSVEERTSAIIDKGLREDIKSFISYAVGCMLGRYSLDVDGLTFAGGELDNSKYTSFIPDADNIIPITDEEYFSDDIVGRFVEFVKTVYGEDTLEVNIDFIAQALGNKGDISREVIRKYFIKDFYADHLKVYQKRPIYWLFDSGKQNGFKALIYMHRYDADTVGRVRTDYLHKAQKYVETAMQSAQYTLDNASSSSEKSKATKSITKYTKQLAEMQLYDEAIAHIANQRIEIDLDDGVKVNYAKFQGVEVAQEGKKALKVDLLAKI